jgi:DeoR/GlpR family transcriptional regulator of sugar metabolism
MYPQERRESLLTLLSHRGFMSYREMATYLEVSEITVRRDLRVLQAQGLVTTVMGGGQVAKSARELPYQSKRVLQQAEKEAIAKAAVDMIESGMTLSLGAGTTTWMIAKKITAYLGLTDLHFVTNSPNVAEALQENGWQEVYLTGGQYRTPSDALVGPLAESAMRQFHTDLLFLGASGVDVSDGFSTPNLLEAALNRVMMEQTDQVVLAVDHAKWGLTAMCQIANLEDVDVLLTDNQGGAEEIGEVRSLDVQVVEVPVLTSNVDHERT